MPLASAFRQYSLIQQVSPQTHQCITLQHNPHMCRPVCHQGPFLPTEGWTLLQYLPIEGGEYRKDALVETSNHCPNLSGKRARMCLKQNPATGFPSGTTVGLTLLDDLSYGILPHKV